MWMVTVGDACFPDLRDRTDPPGAGVLVVDVVGVSDRPWMAQNEAATAAWRRRSLAGRLLACARRLPAGEVSMAEWMCGERLARRNAVTRLVSSSGGGGGICITRDMMAVRGGR